MSRHRSPAAPRVPRRRGVTLLAAAGLALGTAAVPAGFALAGNDTTTPGTTADNSADGTAAEGAGSLLDVELPQVCLDLDAALDTLKTTPTDATALAAKATAEAKIAAENVDCTPDEAPTTTTPPTTTPPTTTPTTTTPLPPVLGGTGGQGGTGGTGGSGSTTTNPSTTIDVPGSDSSSGDADGDGDSDTVTPSGSADTGGWGA